MGSKLLKMQPTLVHVPTEKDLVMTPRWLARDIIAHFQPSGRILDPCRGDGAFFDQLPEGADWCEIREGRDFFAYVNQVDWIVSNPPYSCLLSWIRHSFKVARNIVYLAPLHRVMASCTFLEDVAAWGGLAEVYVIGTGATAGFPFGHALAAVHFQRGYRGGTRWTYCGAIDRICT